MFLVCGGLMILRPNDVKMLAKTKTREYIFKHITNRLSRKDEDSQTDNEKQRLKESVAKLLEITEFVTD